MHHVSSDDPGLLANFPKMIGRRCALLALGGILILVLSVNVYFIRMIVEDSPRKSNSEGPGDSYVEATKRAESADSVGKARALKGLSKTKYDPEGDIQAEMRMLPSKYFKRDASYKTLRDRLLAELKIMTNSRENIWSIPKHSWPDSHHLIPAAAPELGTILAALRTAEIVKADNAARGTQLKMMLTLDPEYRIKAIFKPKWYSRSTVIKGPVYEGKDRHNSEVVAFHLSSLLALRRAPITVIRRVNLEKEIRKRASPELFATMYQDGNNSCLYGVCYYCSPADPVCAHGEDLEGALILWLPSHLPLTKHRNPWQRTYKANRLAQWETDSSYCEKVKETKAYSIETSSRLLDLVDTAIFDFLMNNGDRHHYELFETNFHNPAVLLIDNGKGLGDPDVDHFDILAPLYQCCLIHKTMWDRLRLMSGGALSSSLRKLLDYEARAADVPPLITEDHLNAMDRRLLAVYAVVESCLKKKKYTSSVILDHR